MQSLWMLAASFFFATMGMLIKLASTQHNLGEIILFRGFPSIILIVAYAIYHQRPLLGNNLKIHARRNIVGVLSMWMGFYGTTHLPLHTATTLNYTSPLFIALFMLYQGYFPGVFRQQWLRFGTIIVGFIGVLCIFNPFAEKVSDHVALFVALLGGMMGALAYMTVRSLGHLGEPEWRTVMLFSCSAALSGLLGVMLLGVSHYTLGSTVELIGLGLAGMGGQLCMTRAFGRGSTALTATLQYTTIIFSALFGYWVWDEATDAIGLIGIALIVMSGLSATMHTKKMQ